MFASKDELFAVPSGAYTISRSVRLRSSASAYLNRTLTTPTNNLKWTWSAWVKRGTLGTSNPIFYGGDGSSNNFGGLTFNANDTMQFAQVSGGAYNVQMATSAVFRDPSAWYHIVLVYDSANATSTDRIQIYINGTRQTVSYTTGPFAQNTASKINSAVAHYLGKIDYTAVYLDSYLTEINFIDGQALTPSSFGSTNATTGVWQPKKYTGTYGTNGFYLNFSNNASTTTLGYDTSGNSNNWTTNNISLTSGTTYDSMTDVPTLTSATVANYAVLNPLNIGSTVTISNGNLTMTEVGTYATTVSSIAMTSGKWYAEMTAGSNTYAGAAGIAKLGYSPTTRFGFQANTWNYNNDGGLYYNSTLLATVSSYTTNDVIGVAFDADNLTITLYKNGTQQGTQFTSGNSGLTAGEFYFATGHINSTSNWNFGQRPFTYTAPSGFVALNTYNLPASTIVKGNTVMDATLYTGNLVGQSITNSSGFYPDLVWIKSRSAATDHKLTDTVRGATKALISDTTGAETTDVTGLTAFNSNGFTLGASTVYNNTGATYVGWQWQAGQGSSSSNTNGSITSTVSVNATAGFSVVTYTGNATANATIGHGLGVAPSMVIVKVRSGTGGWWIYHTSTGKDAYLDLSSTAASASSANYWGTTGPTSTTFQINGGGGVNNNGSTYVAYCWSAVAGFSKFGSYTGNGSTDGPFVYCGFRPKFILVKSSSGTFDWHITDTSRSTYNQADTVLFPNLSAAETNGGGYYYDLLSNGFKCRNLGSATNGSGATYIFAAFAESPFKNALAR